MQRPELGGLYHLTAGGQTSWYDYARFVIEFARPKDTRIKVAPDAIQPVPSSAFSTAAQRPHNSRLDTHKLQTTFSLRLPAWRRLLRRAARSSQ